MEKLALNIKIIALFLYFNFHQHCISNSTSIYAISLNIIMCDQISKYPQKKREPRPSADRIFEPI